jgi:hypothetical protein
VPLGSTGKSRVAPSAGAASMYAAQRAYVAALFDVMGRLLVAASECDPELEREIAGFRDGLVIGFSVLGSPNLRLRLGVRDKRFVRLPNATPAELEIVFKHVSHAFLVLTFQEGTAQAYANERMITLGDTSLSLRFMRCLNRMEAATLPRFVVLRALKSAPDITAPEKRRLASTIFGRLARGLVSRSRP